MSAGPDDDDDGTEGGEGWSGGGDDPSGLEDTDPGVGDPIDGDPPYGDAGETFGDDGVFSDGDAQAPVDDDQDVPGFDPESLRGEADRREGGDDVAEIRDDVGAGDDNGGGEGLGEPDAWNADVAADVFGDASEWPAATAEDFEDDAGDWSVADYSDTARALFGDEPHFGESPEQRYWDRGYQPASPAYASWFESALSQLSPAASDTVKLFWSGGSVVAAGFVTAAAIAALRRLDPNLDLSALHVTEPDRRGDDVAPAPLPPSIAAIDPRDSVDLRRFCSPVGDQGQTSRCSAFAWTHALELVRKLGNRGHERLSCSYTMLGFQQMMGDAQDYAFAYAGGDGTVAGTAPGDVLTEKGTCRHELWPDDEEEPRASQHEMSRDAREHRLAARLQNIALDDVRHVLSAGCPVHVGMNTGRGFSSLGRDGIVDAAEQPSGRHGRHAMLIVGYTGNYFIVKNSWGTDWGADGYCFIPKRVMSAADATFVAILHEHAKAADPPRVADPGGEPLASQASAHPSAAASYARVYAPWGQQMYPAVVTEVHGALGRVLFDGGSDAWVSLDQLQPPIPAQPPPWAHNPWQPGQRVWAPSASSPQVVPATVWYVHGRLVYAKLDDHTERWLEASECRA